MKTGALLEDILTQSGQRQTHITQSQRDSWLRLMEHERSTRFAAVQSDKGTVETSGTMSQTTRPFDFAGIRNSGLEQPSTSGNGSSLASGTTVRTGNWADAAEAYGREAAINQSGFSSLAVSGQNDSMLGSEGFAVDFGSEAAAAQLFFERLLRQRWPRSSVFVIRNDDGVQVWIRDADLPADPQSLAAVVVQIKKTLANEGWRLASLTVNGETVSYDQED